MYMYVYIYTDTHSPINVLEANRATVGAQHETCSYLESSQTYLAGPDSGLWAEPGPQASAIQAKFFLNSLVNLLQRPPRKA